MFQAFIGVTGKPVDWNRMDLTSSGLTKRGYIINVLVNGTTGMISFEIFKQCEAALYLQQWNGFKTTWVNESLRQTKPLLIDSWGFIFCKQFQLINQFSLRPGLRVNCLEPLISVGKNPPIQP
jgi:hypothetical protein